MLPHQSHFQRAHGAARAETTPPCIPCFRSALANCPLCSWSIRILLRHCGLHVAQPVISQHAALLHASPCVSSLCHSHQFDGGLLRPLICMKDKHRKTGEGDKPAHLDFSRSTHAMVCIGLHQWPAARRPALTTQCHYRSSPFFIFSTLNCSAWMLGSLDAGDLSTLWRSSSTVAKFGCLDAGGSSTLWRSLPTVAQG